MRQHISSKMNNVYTYLMAASVINVCNGVVTFLSVTGEDNYFTSFGYPASYSSNSDENWYLTSSNASDVINLIVMDSELEYSTTCVYDYVSVYDGPSSSSTLLLQFCGHTAPSLTSTGSSLYVYFHSDSSVQRRGFKIKYWGSKKSLPSSSPDDTTTTIIFTIAVTGGIAILLSLLALIYYCSTKKPQARARVAPTSVHVQPLNLGRNPRRMNPRYYHYTTPRTPSSVNAANYTFYDNPGAALPDYRSLYPLTPPPPYSECQTGAAP